MWPLVPDADKIAEEDSCASRLLTLPLGRADHDEDSKTCASVRVRPLVLRGSWMSLLKNCASISADAAFCASLIIVEDSCASRLLTLPLVLRGSFKFDEDSCVSIYC